MQKSTNDKNQHMVNEKFILWEVLMKKKVVSVLMAAAMVAGMAGCGSSNTGNAGTTNSNASTNNEATTESGDASASTATDSDVEKPEEITIMVHRKTDRQSSLPN